MKRAVTITLLILLNASCRKDKGKEYSGNYLIRLTIHPTELSYIVPSSDTTQLWINELDSTQAWGFSPIGDNEYSISPTGNSSRVLSADSNQINIIVRPVTLSDKEHFFIDKGSNSDEISFRSVASGNVLKVGYAEKNNTIWGYGISMLRPNGCPMSYSNVDTQWCISSFKLIRK